MNAYKRLKISIATIIEEDVLTTSTYDKTVYSNENDNFGTDIFFGN